MGGATPSERAGEVANTSLRWVTLARFGERVGIKPYTRVPLHAFARRPCARYPCDVGKRSEMGG